MTSRRAVMGWVLALGLWSVPGLAQTADYARLTKVAYQNDGGWPVSRAYFQRLLADLGKIAAATDGKADVRVVSYGDGVRLLMMARDDAAFAHDIDALRAKGVRFLVCANTLRVMKLTVGDLYGLRAADTVPSGPAEIARLREAGYTYFRAE